MAEEFNKYATRGAYHWAWYDDPNWTWYKECVDKIVEFCKGSTLDLGCGDAFVMQKIAELGHYVTGIDKDSYGMQLGQQLSGLPLEDFWHMDIETMDLNDYNQWDYLASLNVIEHLRNPDIFKLILSKNIRRGAIIITDEAREQKGRYHEHEFTLEELQDLFKEFKTVPFKIESTEFGKPITFIGVEVYKDKRRGRPPKVKK